MAKSKRKRRPNGAAWHRQHDDCWYSTISGQRVKLTDEEGLPIRGKDNLQAADLAASRLKVGIQPIAPPTDWTVARVAERYLAHVQRDFSPRHYTNCQSYLNDFCAFCGALTINELRKRHLQQQGQRALWAS